MAPVQFSFKNILDKIFFDIWRAVRQPADLAA
jgi:hypothetical protein